MTNIVYLFCLSQGRKEELHKWKTY